MINVSDAEDQKEMSYGPIPKWSIVKVKLEIRQPKKADPQDPAVNVCSTGLKGLDCQFTVVSGTYVGVKIWENIFLPPSMQAIEMTEGQTGICNAGATRVKTILRAVRNLDKNAPSSSFDMTSWFDLHGLEFSIKVGMDDPKEGDLYINNTISRILVNTDKHYTEVMAGGEVISNEPIPPIPEAKNGTGKPANKKQWSQGGGEQPETVNPEPQQQSLPGTGTTPESQQQSNTPPWAQ